MKRVKDVNGLSQDVCVLANNKSLHFSNFTWQEALCSIADVHDIFGHPGIVEIDAALQADVRRTKENSTGDKTTSPGIDASASQVGKPIEVVEAPEFSEECSTGHAALLLSCISTNSVKETKLEPTSCRVTVCKSGFICVPVLMSLISQFRLIGESVTAIALQQSLILLSKLFLKVDLLVTFFELASLSDSPAIMFVRLSVICTRHFFPFFN